MLNELNLLQSEKSSCKWYYRGQGNASWGLIPSLFRLQNIQDKKYFEQCVLESMKQKLEHYSTIPDRLIHNQDYLLALAQHYGTPTRMLDWTLSPLIASYFAASSAIEKQDASSLAVFCIPSIFFIGEHGKQAEIVNSLAGANENLISQNGIFLKHDWEFSNLWDAEYDYEIISTIDYPNDTIDSRIIRVELPTTFAAELIEELQDRGVNSICLFPGIYGYAKDASDQAWIRQKMILNT